MTGHYGKRKTSQALARWNPFECWGDNWPRRFSCLCFNAEFENPKYECEISYWWGSTAQGLLRAWKCSRSEFGFRFVHAQSPKLCLTLCDCVVCSPPGSLVHGILQTRILEGVAISSSRGSPRRRDQGHISCGSALAGRFFTTEPHGKPFEFPLLGNNISTCITGTT